LFTVSRHIVAVGLLTEEDLDMLGNTFTRLWPVDGVPKFDELLAAIDEADQTLELASQANGFGSFGP
jgi:hypothetical protein